MKEKASKRQKETKKDRSDKFCYSSGDIKFIKAKKSVKESYSSFAEFLFEKEEVPFNDKTMRWITIKDERDRNQHILIKKKDGTILGGMGGEHTGEKLKDVFDDLEDKRDDLEKEKEDALEREISKYAKEIEEFREYAINEYGVHDVYGLKEDDISPEEYASISEYTGSSYTRINNYYRDYDKWREEAQESVWVSPDDYDTDEEYEEALEHELSEMEMEMESMGMDISKALKENPSKDLMISYRGLAPDLIQQIKDDLEVGNEFSDDGFASSSTDIEIAQKFSKGGYIMEIHIPKGSRAASIKNLSMHQSEQEVLIDKGSRFFIKQVDHEKKSLVVELRQD
jgi:hypothetical protein